MNQNSSFLNLMNIKNARRSLNTDGYLIIENGYSQDFCKSIIRFMDEHKSDDKTEEYYAGTELRIWDAQKKGSLLDSFSQECNVFISCLLCNDTEAYTLLAIRNNALDQADKLSTIGRWHIDSFRKMLKIFLFLTDTTELSGPFEFIPRTHTKSFKFQMLCNGSYFKASDIFSGRRPYQKLDDIWVNELSAKGYSPVPVICKAGTILVVDTSAIHRARPCLQGSRYALTAYYR